MKVKITNETRLKTQQLRAFAKRALDLEIDPEKQGRQVREITFRHQRHRGPTGIWCSGVAYRLSNDCVIYLPKAWALENYDCLRLSLALVLCHELAHLRGLTHKEMRGSSRYRYLKGWREVHSWALCYPLDLPAPKVKPNKEEVLDAALNRAKRNLEAWQKKLRRAEGRVGHWEREIKRISRRVAAIRVRSGGLES